jgi:uncharacterized protein
MTLDTNVRDKFPDALRGFALLGIAIVNLPFLAIATLLGPEATDLSKLENSVPFVVMMGLFTAKFYLLFSFLFGYSAQYIIQGDKANRRRWVFRCLGLILLGVLHFTFLFHGDILFLYGLFGLLLLAFYFRSDKTLKVWSWVIYGLTALAFFALSALTLLGEAFFAMKGKPLPELPGSMDEFGLDAAISSGGFLDAIVPRLTTWVFAAPQALFLQGTLVLVGFLIGVLVSRKRGLTEVNPRLMKRYLRLGLGLGLPLQLLSAFMLLNNELGSGSFGLYLGALGMIFLSAPLLSAAYVACIWFLLNSGKELRLLRSAGKMSLTIYLSQSLIFSTLFSAWGFGWFGELNLSQTMIVSIAVWLTLSTLAMIYLKYRNKGPMEALLSSFSKLFVRRK